MQQLHKRFSDEQVKAFIERYLRKEIERPHLENLLDVKTRQFWKLVRKYRQSPVTFSLKDTRITPPRSLDQATERNISTMVQGMGLALPCMSRHGFHSFQMQRRLKEW